MSKKEYANRLLSLIILLLFLSDGLFVVEPKLDGSLWNRSVKTSGKPYLVNERKGVMIVEASPAQNVPFFSMDDERWASDEIGSSGSNISELGCVVTSVAMLLTYYGVDTDPGKLNAWLSALPINNSGYTPAGALIWIKAADYSQEVTWIDNSNDDTWSFSDDTQDHWDKLNEELDNGYPVLVKVDAYTSTPYLDEHWVLVTQREGDNYYINDPDDAEYNPNKLLSHYYNQNSDNAIFAMRFYHGPHPTSDEDNIYPTVDAFSVTNSPVTLGNGFSISYTVTDSGGSGLNRVEYWRKYEENEWQMTSEVSLVNEGDGPYEGSYTDTPDQVGTYWYGIHVADNAGNWNDEQNSHTDGLPGDYGPVEVTVRTGASWQQAWVYETDYSPSSVSVSMNGSYIAVGSSNKVYFLNHNGSLLWDYTTNDPIVDVSMIADASQITASSSEGFPIPDGTVYWFDNQGELFHSIESTGVSSVSMSPEGSYFAMTYVHWMGWNDVVKIWGYEEGEWLWTQSFGDDRTAAVSVSSGGEFIAVGGAKAVTLFDGGGLQLYNKAGDLLWEYEIDTTYMGGDKYSVSISSDGKYIAAGNRDNDYLYFFGRDQGLIWSYYLGEVRGVSVSDDGSFIAVATFGAVYLFDDRMNLLWTTEISFLEDVAISADATLIVAVTKYNEVYAFEIQDVPSYEPLKLIVATDKPSYKPDDTVWISYEMTPNKPYNIEMTITDPNQQQTTITGTPPTNKDQIKYTTTSTEGTYTIQTTATTQTQTTTKTRTFTVEQPLQNILQQYKKPDENVYHWHTIKNNTKTYKIYIYTNENLGKFDQTTKQHLTTSDHITGVLILDENNQALTDINQAQTILAAAQFHKYYQNNDSPLKQRLLSDEAQETFENTLNWKTNFFTFFASQKPSYYLNWRKTSYKELLLSMIGEASLESPQSKFVQDTYNVASYLQKANEAFENIQTLGQLKVILKSNSHLSATAISDQLFAWLEKYDDEIIVSKVGLVFLFDLFYGGELTSEQLPYLAWVNEQNSRYPGDDQHKELSQAIDEIIGDHNSKWDDLKTSSIETLFLLSGTLTDKAFDELSQIFWMGFFEELGMSVSNPLLTFARYSVKLGFNFEDQVWEMKKQLAASELQEIALNILHDKITDPRVWSSEPELEDILYGIQTQKVAILSEAEFFQSEITINNCGVLRILANFALKILNEPIPADQLIVTVDRLKTQAKYYTPGLPVLDRTTKTLISALRPINDPVPYTSIIPATPYTYINTPTTINITLNNPYTFNLENIWVNSTSTTPEYNPPYFHVPLMYPNQNITLTSILDTNRSGIFPITYNLYADNNTIIKPIQTTIMIYHDNLTASHNPEYPVLFDNITITIDDSTGAPVSNAAIELFTSNDTRTYQTDILGEVSFTANETGLWSYSFFKTNYRTKELGEIVIKENTGTSSIFTVEDDLVSLTPNGTHIIPFILVNTGNSNNTVSIEIIEYSSDILVSLDLLDSIGIYSVSLILVNESKAVGLLESGRWCSGLVTIKTPPDLDGNPSVLIKTTVNEVVKLYELNFTTTPSLNIDITKLSNQSLTHNDNATLLIESFDNRGIIVDPAYVAVFIDGINMTGGLVKNGTGSWLLDARLPWGLHIVSVEATKPGYINGTESTHILVHESTLKLNVSTNQIDYTHGSPIQLNASLYTPDNEAIINGTVTVTVSSANQTHTQTFNETSPGQYISEFTVNPENPTTYINLTVTAEATGYKKESQQITIPVYSIEFIENNLTITEVDLTRFNATINVKLRNYITNTSEAVLLYQVTDSSNTSLVIIKKNVNITSKKFFDDSTTFTLTKSGVYAVDGFVWSGLPSDDMWSPFSKPLRIVFNEIEVLPQKVEDTGFSLLQVQPDQLVNCTLSLEPIKFEISDNESVEINGGVYSVDQPVRNVFVGVQVTGPVGGLGYLGQIRTDEDGRFNSSFRLALDSVPGIYDVIVSFNGKQIHELINQSVSLGDDDFSSGAVQLTLNTPYSATINPAGDVDYYKFNATPGDYGFETFSNIDTYLHLYDTDGETEITSDDDSGEDLNARISWECTSPGVYYLKVRGYDEYETGEYSVLVSRAGIDILLVVDDDGYNWEAGTSSTKFEYVLSNLGHNYTVWNESRDGRPSLTQLLQYDLVIWTCGDYWRGAVDDEDATTLIEYIQQGGNLILEGDDIGYDHESDEFMRQVAHAIMQVDYTGAPGITVIDENDPLVQGLPHSISWTIDPPYDDGVLPTNNGYSVMEYTGTEYSALIAYRGITDGSVVYIAFPLYSLSDEEAEILIGNAVDWFTPRAHDLSLEMNAPVYVIPGESGVISLEIWNLGLSNESDIQVSLFANGTLLSETIVPEIRNGSHAALSFDWSATAGYYNITAVVSPVPFENVTNNNRVTTWVDVSYNPRHLGTIYLGYNEALVIEDVYFTQYGNIYLYDEARLVLRNATLNLEYGLGPSYQIHVSGNATFFSDDAFIVSENWPRITLRDDSITHLNSTVMCYTYDQDDWDDSKWPTGYIYTYDRSQLLLWNSTVRYLYPYDYSTLTALQSRVINIRPDPWSAADVFLQGSEVDTIRLGFTAYSSSAQSLGINSVDESWRPRDDGHADDALGEREEHARRPRESRSSQEEMAPSSPTMDGSSLGGMSIMSVSPVTLSNLGTGYYGFWDSGDLGAGVSWSLVLVDTEVGYWDVSTYGSAWVSIGNSSISSLYCDDDSRVDITDSTIHWGPIIDDRAEVYVEDSSLGYPRLYISYSSVYLAELVTGYYGYWNIHQNGSVSDLDWNLTLVNTDVFGRWRITAGYNSVVGIFDSDLRDINCWSNSDVSLDGSTVESLAIEDSSNVSITNTTIHYNLDTWGYNGVLHFENAIVQGRLYIDYSDFIVEGDVDFDSVDVEVWDSTVLRRFSVEAFNGGSPVAGVSLSVQDEWGSTVWSGLTDIYGLAYFDLAFDDDNYTSTGRLITESTSFNVGLTTDTPIKITDAHAGELEPVVEIGVIIPSDSSLETAVPLVTKAETDINNYMEEHGYNVTFDFLIENAQESPAIHLEKVQGFRAIDVNLLVAGGWSSQASGSLSYINENNMLILSPSSTSPILAIADDNLFRLSPDEEQIVTVISEMLLSADIEAVVIMQRIDLWADYITNALETEYTQRGGYIDSIIEYPVQTAEFSSYLALADDAIGNLITEYGVDHVGFLILSFSEAATIATQAEEYPNLWSVNWFGSDGTALSRRIRDDASAQADHLKILSPILTPLNNTKYRILNEWFTSEIGYSLQLYSANWYDACWVIALSTIEANSSNALDVKPILPTVAADYEGVTGPIVLNDAGDRDEMNYDIWGYGIVNGTPSHVKYGYYNGTSGEIQWIIDLVSRIETVERWNTTLSVEVGGYNSEATFGVRENATIGFDEDAGDQATPPGFMGVEAYFWYPDDPTPTLRKLSTSYYPVEYPVNWTLKVHTFSGTSGNTTLTWNSIMIDGIPSNYSVTLYTPTQDVDMRSNHSYSWDSEEDTIYSFTILVSVEVEFTLELRAGWNMVSLPVVPDDPMANAVMPSGLFYQLVTWTGTGYVAATEFEAGRGYWLLVLEDVNVTVTGIPVDEVTLTLSPGWSMIGGPNSVVQASEVFPGFYQLVTWTGTGYTPATVFEPGKGYWALVLEETQIQLPPA